MSLWSAQSLPATVAMIAGLGLVAGTGWAEAARPPLALINETVSVPRGLYVRSADPQPRLGRLVTIAQPPNVRSYLAGLGVPADMRLLKRVSAIGGQRVCTRGGVLQAPAGRVAVLRQDRRGTPLPAWRGCRVLAPDELLVLGDTRTSFDGRYFGPIPRTAVEATYTQVLRW